MKSFSLVFNQSKISTHLEKATGRQLAALVTQGSTLGMGKDVNLALKCLIVLSHTQQLGSRSCATAAPAEMWKVESVPGTSRALLSYHASRKMDKQKNWRTKESFKVSKEGRRRP